MVGDGVEVTGDTAAATVVVVMVVAVGEIRTFLSGKAGEVAVEILRAIVVEEGIEEDVENFVVIIVVIIVAAVAGILEVEETSAVVEAGFEALAPKVHESLSECNVIKLIK